MTQPYTPTSYRRAFVKRVRAARVMAGLEPLEIAKLLDVPKDTYLRYETRTLLPLYLHERFCEITRQNVDWLVTGAHRRPESDAIPAPARKQA